MLLQLVDLFRSYFEGALNENSVKRNFVLIYELLEETMDFGFPQLTGLCVAGTASWLCALCSMSNQVTACSLEHLGSCPNRHAYTEVDRQMTQGGSWSGGNRAI